MTILIAGVDEAGRGPLAGPVTAAAVILAPERPIQGLNDSKKLSEKRREALFADIRERALAWCVAQASVEEIDSHNILAATFIAMQRAVAGLNPGPSEILVDGNRAPEFSVPVTTIIGGDATEPAISAASILAKVARDRMMYDLDREYPDYGFAKHKGYPTAAHREQLRRLGPCPAHRRSYAPVRDALQGARDRTVA